MTDGITWRNHTAGRGQRHGDHYDGGNPHPDDPQCIICQEPGHCPLQCAKILTEGRTKHSAIGIPGRTLPPLKVFGIRPPLLPIRGIGSDRNMANPKFRRTTSTPFLPVLSETSISGEPASLIQQPLQLSSVFSGALSSTSPIPDQTILPGLPSQFANTTQHVQITATTTPPVFDMTASDITMPVQAEGIANDTAIPVQQNGAYAFGCVAVPESHVQLDYRTEAQLAARKAEVDEWQMKHDQQKASANGLTEHVDKVTTTWNK